MSKLPWDQISVSLTRAHLQTLLDAIGNEMRATENDAESDGNDYTDYLDDLSAIVAVLEGALE